MASSRIGGTSGKLRGQIGDTVYQVRREADGSFTQIIYQKGERVETQTSPKLQAQRMCVAIVESLMRDLKAIGNISFQSGKNKSQSLNAFSSNNLRMVKRDCEANWYHDNRFVYPKHLRTDIQIRDLGGPYIISSGSLSGNIFDREVFSEYAGRDYDSVAPADQYFYGVEFDCQIGVTTVGQFIRAHRMSKLDRFGFCFFRQWLSWPGVEEEGVILLHHNYIIGSFNTRLADDTIITPDVVTQLFALTSDVDPVVLIGRNGDRFAIGKLCDYYRVDEQCYYMTGFSISQVSGKKQISTSFYHTPDGSDDPWYNDSAPCHVFGSWMSQYDVDPYPSPF